MPKQKKAARGKHRRIGFHLRGAFSRTDISELLNNSLGHNEWRLFDVIGKNESSLAILKTPLHCYQDVIECINNNHIMSTITSSGKIRLVRHRLNSTLGNKPPDSL